MSRKYNATGVRLRIHHFVPASVDTLGPGRRAVVWVQGCSIHCPGCILPEAWDPAGGCSVDPEKLGRQLLTRSDVEGLTITGGEPTDQPDAVSILLRAFKAAGRNTWLFTGKRLEDLIAAEDASLNRLLSLIDTIVDGPFISAQAGRFVLRGSGNQRVIPLTHDIPSHRYSGMQQRIEITIGPRGELVLIGIPEKGFLPRFQATLQRRGVAINEFTSVNLIPEDMDII